jgi:hypothetical protein
MDNYAPSTFLGVWVLVVPYLCSRFHIFDRPILEKYVFQVKGAPPSFNHAFVQHEITFFS